jgi:hypothetical protein
MPIEPSGSPSLKRRQYLIMITLSNTGSQMPVISHNVNYESLRAKTLISKTI